MFHATIAYKEWVRAEIAKRGTFDDFVAELARVGTDWTSGGLSYFLGSEKKGIVPSNTEHMPAINRVLGIAPPSVCDPSSPLSQLKDRIDAMWRSMDDDGRLQFVEVMEKMLGLVDRK